MAAAADQALSPIPTLEYFDQQESFYLACKENNIQLVDLLLKDRQTDPEFMSNRAIITAIQLNHDQIVKLLLDSKRINPMILRSLFVEACDKGLDNVVKVFLDFRKKYPFPPAIDPSEEDLEAMHVACFMGRAGVVQLLIEEGGIDPSIDRDMPIRTAIMLDQYGDNEKVIRLLLQYPSVNPSARSNEALDRIMREGNLFTLRYLLEIDDPRINPYIPETFDFLLSAADDHGLDYPEIIKLLERDARFVIPNFLHIGTQSRDKSLEKYLLSKHYVYSKKYDNVLHLLPHHAPVGGPFGTTNAWGWGHSPFSLRGVAVGGPPTADLEYLARNKEKLALMGSYSRLPGGHRLRHFDDRLSFLISSSQARKDGTSILDFLKGKRTRHSNNRKKRTNCKKSKNK